MDFTVRVLLLILVLQTLRGRKEKVMDKSVRVGLLLAGISLTLCLGILYARSDVLIGTGLVCDTQTQAEQYVEKWTGDSDATLKLVNDAAGPNSCLIATVVFTDPKQVSLRRNSQGLFEITEITVLGSPGFKFPDPIVWYTLVPFTGREAKLPLHLAQHRHPVQDIPLHEKFYATRMRPDNPKVSCCNMMDCYPTEIKFTAGKLYARRREDGHWLPIPPEKIERNRDNPDGRNHICAPSPTASYPENTVFCFTLGWSS